MAADSTPLDTDALLAALTALKNGDFSARMPAGDGEAGRIAEVLNAVMAQNALLTGEVRRIAREVGPEGRFGGQAEVPGLAGAWSELVADVNRMGSLLTEQIRDLSQTSRALAGGSTERKVTAPAYGETLELQQHLNAAIERVQRMRAG
jgi:HAMP domain-containing protein